MREEFRIEKGIPMPTTARECWHPFGEMEIGDCVFIPVKPGRGFLKIRNAAHEFGRKHQRKFIVREQSGGARVWRAA